MMFEGLKDYQPEKIQDKGFDIVVARGVTATVDSAMVEEYTGDIEGLKDTKSYKYTLTLVDSGRKIFGNYMLTNENQLKKLANIMFTLGLEFLPSGDLPDAEYLHMLEENLFGISQAFTQKALVVDCFKQKKFKKVGDEFVVVEGEYKQGHLIKGETDLAETENTPF